MREPLKFAVLGCGARGQLAADWIKRHPAEGTVVAIAEPDRARRDFVGNQLQIPQAMRFERWEDLLKQPRLADAVVNTLMDRLHCASAKMALDLGYHMLLEKPMAVTLDDCIAIDEARRTSNQIVSVCHSLRYHAVYREAKRLIDSGSWDESSASTSLRASIMSINPTALYGEIGAGNPKAHSCCSPRAATTLMCLSTWWGMSARG